MKDKKIKMKSKIENYVKSLELHKNTELLREQVILDLKKIIEDIPVRLQEDFCNLFYFAESKHGIGWNDANDFFFGNALEYKSFDEFSDPMENVHLEKELTNIEILALTIEDMEDLGIEDDCSQSYVVIAQYMIENNIDELMVDNR